MENKNKKTSLIDRFKNMSRNKKILFALGILSFISIVFIAVVSSNKNVTTVAPSPTPETTNVTEGPTGLRRNNVNEVYLINRFDSLDGVIGFSWLNNVIVYATKDGIFTLWQNKPIINGSISQIDFSKNGRAVYSNSTGTYFADTQFEYSKALNVLDTKAKISDTGNYVLYTESANLVAKKIEDDSNKSITLTQDRNTEVGWASDVDYIYFYNKATSTVDIYNTDFEKTQTFKINKDQIFLGIDSTLTVIATKTNENLYVKDVRTDQTIVYTFSEGSELSATWIAEDQIFVSEKVMRGVYDLYDQNFWIITPSAKYKKFIANTTAIPNKISSTVTPSMNKDKTAIIATENNGKIWAISLITTRMAVYTEKGLSFFNLPNTSKEAD